MREIKFRAWDEEFNKYLEWDFINKIEGYDLFNSPENNLIVEQYIGRKDIKGKEVYDGDIVDIVDEGRHITNLIVKYDNDLCGFVMENNEWRKRLYLVEYIEVIGNIHENKDLLDE